MINSKEEAFRELAVLKAALERTDSSLEVIDKTDSETRMRLAEAITYVMQLANSSVDHAKLIEMDEIRRQHNISIDYLGPLSADDVWHDIKYSSLDNLVYNILATENCLRAMLRELYSIKTLEEYENDQQRKGYQSS